MNKQKRDFKGIWIPKEVWLNEELTMQEKIFFVEIDSLDNNEGCFASNAYFSDFFKISKTRVSIVIQSLIAKGFIKSTLVYKEGTKEILKRVLNKCYRPYITNVIDPTQQMFKDSNTVNNTINKNSVNSTNLPLSKNDDYKDLRYQLETFRKAYPSISGKPGKDVLWNKYNRKKGFRKAIPELMPALHREQAHRLKLESDKEFVPQFKNIET